MNWLWLIFRHISQNTARKLHNKTVNYILKINRYQNVVRKNDYCYGFYGIQINKNNNNYYI